MPTNTSLPERVRIASVQFEMRRIASLEDFEERITHYTRVASEYGAQFVVFPELYTLQTLSLAPNLLGPKEAIEALTAYTPRFEALLKDIAVRYRINVIGGTHVTFTISPMPPCAMAACTGKRRSTRPPPSETIGA
jgi:predicted amidohydrolase